MAFVLEEFQAELQELRIALDLRVSELVEAYNRHGRVRAETTMREFRQLAIEVDEATARLSKVTSALREHIDRNW